MYKLLIIIKLCKISHILVHLYTGGMAGTSCYTIGHAGMVKQKWEEICMYIFYFNVFKD